MGRGCPVMTQFVPNSSGYKLASSPFLGADADFVSTDLNVLLSRCSELKKEITELSRLVKRLGENPGSHGLEKDLRKGRALGMPSRSRGHRNARRKPPVRSELARA